jgi:hypothetical protein
MLLAFLHIENQSIASKLAPTYANGESKDAQLGRRRIFAPSTPSFSSMFS